MQTAKRVGMLLLGLAVMAAALVAVWQLLPAEQVQAAVFEPAVPVSALSAAAADMGDTLAIQKALLDALPQAVRDAGCDTLYFTVNTDAGVVWKKGGFGMDSRLVHPQLFNLINTRFDALAYLGERCAEANVRLVALVQVEALAGVGQPTLADEDTAARVQSAVQILSGDYAVSAVALAFADMPQDTSALRAVISQTASVCSVPFGVQLPAGHPLQTADIGVDFWVAQLYTAADRQAVGTVDASAPVIWRAADAAALAEAAYYAAGAGVTLQSLVWCPVRDTALNADALPALQAQLASPALAVMADSRLPAIPRTLAVAYPADGEVVYTENIYLMGTSDPTQPLTVNGEAVTRTTKSGVFGLLLAMQPGENVITLTQGDQTQALTVYRGTAAAGGSVGTDASVRLAEGRRIRVTSWICSVLSDPDDDDRIRETAKQGGIGVVSRSVQTTRNGVRTWAYELASGGWVLSSNCEVVEDGADPWPIAGLSVSDDGKDEWIMLVEGGTPIGYDNWDEAGGLLRVTLANTVAEAASGPFSSAFLRAVDIQPVDGGVQITFTVGGQRQLWGYDVCYTEAGDTLLYLKGAPAVPLTGEQPLAGAVIMLDAGHGGTDNGAMGAAGGVGGPTEKEVNLAVTLAAAARLEQWGATVILTRDADYNVSLEERSRMTAQLRPDLFLALHHNSIALISDASRVSGSSAYYFTLPGKLLADSLLGPISTAADRPNNGSNWSYFYVTRTTVAPAVLFEYGFLPNPAEYEACCDERVILREGEATAEGILALFRARLEGQA